MKLDDVVDIKVPEPDSHFRLKACQCGSDNVAYALGTDGKWRGRCFDCGNTGEGSQVPHEAQQKWNEEGSI